MLFAAIASLSRFTILAGEESAKIPPNQAYSKSAIGLMPGALSASYSRLSGKDAKCSRLSAGAGVFSKGWLQEGHRG